jgi:hypothetical protein
VDKELLLILAAKDTASGVIGKFRGEVGKAGGAVSGFHGGLVRAGGQIAKVGAIAAGVGVAGFAALATQVFAGVEALKEEYKLNAQTEAVLKSTGGAAGVTAKHVGELADAIKEYSGIDDDAIKKGENLLLTFTNIRNEAGKGNDIFDQSTKILADLATAMGTEPSAAAIQLGKALNDPIKGITALTRVGVTFTQQQKDQIKAMVKAGDTAGAQKVILAELAKEFGGSAKAFGDSAAGMAAKLGNAWQDTQKALAEKVMPLLATASGAILAFLTDPQVQAGIDSLSKGFADVLAGAIAILLPIAQQLGGILMNVVFPALASIPALINDWAKANEPFLTQVRDGINVALNALGDAVKWAGDNLNIVVPFIAGPLVVAFGAWALSAGAAAVATALAMAPLLLVGAAIGALAVAWTNNWGGIRDIVSSVVEVIQPILQNVVVPAIQTVIDIASKLADMFAHLFNDVIAPAIGPIVDALATAWRDVVAPALKAAFDTLKTLMDAFSWLFDNILKPAIDGVLPILKAVFDGIGTVIGTVKGIIDTILGPIQGLLGVLHDVVQAFLDIIGLGPKAGKAYTGPTADDIRKEAGANGAPVGRAFGGRMFAGQVARVGERGRSETFVAPADGYIVPGDLTGGGTGVVVNLGGVSISGVNDPEEIARQIARPLQRVLAQQRMSLG